MKIPIIPNEFKARYAKILGKENNEFLRYCCLPLRKCIRINTLKVKNKKEFVKELREKASKYIEAVNSEALPSATSQTKANENYGLDYFWLKDKGTRGIARGGYWDNQADAGRYAAYVVGEPSYIGQGIGFRCAK